MKKFYKYEAKDKRGRRFASTIQAENEEDVMAYADKRGLQILNLEEDTDAAFRAGGKELEEPGFVPGSNRKRTEILSYALPIGASILGLLAIPLVIFLIKPGPPEQSPEAVIELYLEREAAGDFAGQYELLSTGMRGSYGSVEEYVNERRQRRVQQGVTRSIPSGLKALDQRAGGARYEVRLLRPEGLVAVEMLLRSRQGEWKIDAVRDPAFVAHYLERLKADSDRDERRKLISALKSETRYSDLEIEQLLRESS